MARRGFLKTKFLKNPKIPAKLAFFIKISLQFAFIDSRGFVDSRGFIRNLNIKENHNETKFDNLITLITSARFTNRGGAVKV